VAAQAGIKPEALTSTEAICKMFNSNRLSKRLETKIEEELEEDEQAVARAGSYAPSEGDGSEHESVHSASTAFTTSTFDPSLLHMRPSQFRQFRPSWFSGVAASPSKLQDIDEAHGKDGGAEEEGQEQEQQAAAEDSPDGRRPSLSSLRFVEPQLQLTCAVGPLSSEQADGAVSTSTSTNTSTPVTPTAATPKTPDKATTLTVTPSPPRSYPSATSQVRPRARGFMGMRVARASGGNERSQSLAFPQKCGRWFPS
jgi:hypothetical protein